MTKLIKIEIGLEIKKVIEKIKIKAPLFNFVVREVFNMCDEFKKHNVNVSDNFEYYSIMVCNPSRAYNTMTKSKTRGAILLPPKQIIVYKENSKTYVVYMQIEKGDIVKMLPEDKNFQESLSESCNNIVKLIKTI